MANNGRSLATVEERNPIQVALDNYSDMEDRLAATDTECVQLRDMNRALVQENNLLRENYAELRKQFLSVQAFSVGLTTRLSVIQDVVVQAVEEAAKFTSRTVPSDTPPSKTPGANGDAKITDTDLLPKT